MSNLGIGFSSPAALKSQAAFVNKHSDITGHITASIAPESNLGIIVPGIQFHCVPQRQSRALAGTESDPFTLSSVSEEDRSLITDSEQIAIDSADVN